MTKDIVTTSVMFALAVGCGTDTLNTGSASKPVKHPASLGQAATNINITAEFSSNGDGYVFTNKSDGSVWHAGYSAEMPIYDLQGLTRIPGGESEWHSLLGWCGTGVDSVELQQNESITIIPYLGNIREEISSIRVGMIFAAGQDVWEEVFGSEKQLTRAP